MTERNTIIVAGNENQLKTIITDLLQNYGKSSVSESSGGTYQRLPNHVKGQALIKISFKGTIHNTQDTHAVEKSFRLVKPEHNPKILDYSKVRTFAERIYSKFNNFSFVTGTTVYSYNNPDQGFNRSWGCYQNETEARRVIESLLDIQQFSPVWKCLTESRVVEPGDRFQDPPEREIQGGYNIRLERERPIATVKFDTAWLKYPKVRKEILLANEYGVVVTNLNVLEKLTD